MYDVTINKCIIII